MIGELGNLRTLILGHMTLSFPIKKFLSSTKLLSLEEFGFTVQRGKLLKPIVLDILIKNCSKLSKLNIRSIEPSFLEEIVKISDTFMVKIVHLKLDNI